MNTLTVKDYRSSAKKCTIYKWLEKGDFKAWNKCSDNYILI